jgi:hypothetical protein
MERTGGIVVFLGEPPSDVRRHFPPAFETTPCGIDLRGMNGIAEKIPYHPSSTKEWMVSSTVSNDMLRLVK